MRDKGRSLAGIEMTEKTDTNSKAPIAGGKAGDDPAPAGDAEAAATADAARQADSAGKEIGGPAGPEPTRYGDWERKGRCIDF